MRTTTLAPLGVELEDLDLDRVVPDPGALGVLVGELRRLLADRGVVVLRAQTIDDTGFHTFLEAFGPLVFTEGETPLADHPDLNVITNVGRSRPPRSVFHVDTSYVSRPPAYTALRAVSVPEEGGQTLFTDQYAAHDTLDPTVREALADRQVHHVVTGVSDPGSQQTEAWHPLLRPHPLTGRTSLYLSTPERCREVSGLTEDEGRELIEQLYAHSTGETTTLRHSWRPGDVVMWDNACVLHKADHSGVVGDRVMHRGMVDGYGPLPDAG